MPQTSPDYRDDYWQRLAVQWQKIDDLYSDLWYEDSRRKYLVQKAAESTEAYGVRVRMAVVDNFLRAAVDGYAGLLSEMVANGVPQSLTEFWDDVDLQGNSFEAFWLEVDRAALKHGAAAVLTDFNGSRPYWVLMPLPSLWCPLVTVESGEKSLARLGYLTSVSVAEAEGFGVQNLRQMWVYESNPARATVWMEVESGGELLRGETVEFRRPTTGAGLGEPLEDLPIVWYSLAGDPLFCPSPPPFTGLANLNLLAFNKGSELDAAESVGLMPSFLRYWPGSVPERVGDLIVGGVVEIPAGGDLKALATDPAVIQIAHERQLARGQTLQKLANAFLTGGDTERTATEVVIEASQAKLSLHAIAERKASAIQEALKYWAQFSDRLYRYPDSAGSVEVSASAVDAPISAQERQQIREDFLAGLLTAGQVLAIYKRAGLIPDDLEEEIAPTAMADSQPTLNPTMEDDDDGL